MGVSFSIINAKMPNIHTKLDKIIYIIGNIHALQ